MVTRPCMLALAALIGLLHPAPLAGSEADPHPDRAPATPTLQQQVDELKRNQQQLLQELQELREALHALSRKTDHAAKPGAPRLISVNVHGEIFRGDKHARVAIMEYSDFECSFCSKYASEIYPLIEKDYIRPGKLKYFFRDLPAPGEPKALLKARAARCAGDQARFWEMHDHLFAAPAASSAPDLVQAAQSLGLDTNQFEACLTSEKYTDNVERSAAGARRMDIPGTPAFLIGTLTEDGDFLRTTNVLTGALNYDRIKSALEELVATQPTP